MSTARIEILFDPEVSEKELLYEIRRDISSAGKVYVGVSERHLFQTIDDIYAPRMGWSYPDHLHEIFLLGAKIIIATPWELIAAGFFGAMGGDVYRKLKQTLRNNRRGASQRGHTALLRANDVVGPFTREWHFLLDTVPPEKIAEALGTLSPDIELWKSQIGADAVKKVAKVAFAFNAETNSWEVFEVQKHQALEIADIEQSRRKDPGTNKA